MKSFGVVTGTTVQTLLDEDLAAVIEIVRKTYLTHRAGGTVNPDSYFLRFPEQPRDRIIALPAAITSDDDGIAGIKWISSFPGNIDNNAPRASAILVLNDLADGVPFACMEASTISAVRTAASAVLGALWLNGRNRSADKIAFVGAGIIARTIMDMFRADGWSFSSAVVHDLSANYAQALATHAREGGLATGEVTNGRLDEALKADIVVLATTSSKPYIAPPHAFHAGQIVLNISLRDIDPHLVLDAWNVVDDIDHCLKADTSPHLAEKLCGNRDFLAGTLADLMAGAIALDHGRPMIFSPFGMGILDIALGQSLHKRAEARGAVLPVPNFFANAMRW